MMLSVIKWTLWQRKWSIIWWSVGVFSLIFITLIFYPTVRDQASQLQQSFGDIPDSAAQLLGGNDFFSPVGYLNSQLFFLMLPLILGILSISLGSSLIAKEEQDKTIESLLARPLSRAKLLASKATTGVIQLLVVTFVGLLTTIIISKIVNLEVSSTRIVIATIVCFLLTLSFGSVAFLFTCIGRARGSSLGIASLVAIGGYLISSLSGTVSWLKGPSKVFPFHYYNPESILNGVVQWSNLCFFIFVITVCGILSWVTFRKRDIY